VRQVNYPSELYEDARSQKYKAKRVGIRHCRALPCSEVTKTKPEL